MHLKAELWNSQYSVVVYNVYIIVELNGYHWIIHGPVQCYETISIALHLDSTSRLIWQLIFARVECQADASSPRDSNERLFLSLSLSLSIQHFALTVIYTLFSTSDILCHSVILIESNSTVCIVIFFLSLSLSVVHVSVVLRRESYFLQALTSKCSY